MGIHQQRTTHHAGWTPERVEILSRLWIEGRSATEIMKQMAGGVSRCAVIAKVHRLKLPKRSTTVNHSAPTSPRHSFAVVNILRRAAATDPGLKLPASVPLPGSTPRPWPTRVFGECCWPVGDGEGPDLLSCCNPVHAKGWCAVHFVRGTVTPAAKTKPVGPERHRRAA